MVVPARRRASAFRRGCAGRRRQVDSAAVDAAWLRAGLAWPIRPLASARAVLGSGAPGRFAIAWGAIVSIAAGARAGVALDGLFHPGRFASSALGFVVLPALLWLGGRPLGGAGSFRALAAVVVGSTIHFLAVDAVAIAAGGWGRALVAVDALAWAWAAVLLVVGTAEAQRFSRARALGALAIAAGLVAALAAIALAVVGAFSRS